MADELDLEQLDQQIEQDNKVEKRIKDLSEKVRLTSEERDEGKKRIEEQQVKLAEAQRERDFYAGFADVIVSNPIAKDHKDDILAKVKSGYSVEDATFAVLGKAGKLGQPVPPPVPQPIVDNPAGGTAAVTQPVTGGQKSPNEMTREEKRAKLVEAESRGEISMS